MKLIIDISDEDYAFVKNVQHVILGRGTSKTVQYNVINSIKNGIPYESVDPMPIKEDTHKAYWDSVGSIDKVGRICELCVFRNRPSERPCYDCRNHNQFLFDGNVKKEEGDKNDL